MRKFTLLFCFLALVSCSDNDDSDTLSPGPGDTDSINTEFINIDIGEFHPAEGDRFKLQLYCETKKEYPSIRNKIKWVQSIGSNRVDITFTGVDMVGIASAFGPANTSIDLSDLRNGTYRLKINNIGMNNSGLLTITDEDVSVEFMDQQTVDFKRTSMRRMPANTYFGSITYVRGGNPEIVNEFIDRLKQIDGVAGVNNQVPGNYTYFEINEIGMMPGNGGPLLSTLVFQYKGNDNAKFRNELDALASSYINSIQVYLECNTGKGMVNWSDADGV